MLRERSVVVGWGRAQHGEIAINLAAVGVDDHSAGPLGKGKRKCRLAACGRPRD
jgi:hypothetical protein